MTPAASPLRVGMVNLGCVRNVVDAEVLMSRLSEHGCDVQVGAEDCDVAVVNTCGFTQEATEESLNTLFELAQLKQRGNLQAIVMAGCLSQRYRDSLKDELVEVDGFIGVEGFDDIFPVLERVRQGERSEQYSAGGRWPGGEYPTRTQFLTPSHVVYLKISEGCTHRCSFCIIPQMKGRHRSRSIEAIVSEASALVEERGVKELVLIGQDTSTYGVDRYREPALAKLLRALDQRVGHQAWIRVLYIHPEGLSDAIIDVVANSNGICPYLDVPIEHANDDVLKRMRRGTTQQHLRERVRKVRASINDVTLRTSVIVGFPGEQKEEFNDLLDFLRETRFERLGAFQYSQEAAADAAEWPDQVEKTVQEQRWHAVMQVQQDISREHCLQWLNREVTVLIDEAAPEAADTWLGRTMADAPDVDGMVYIRGERLSPGDLVSARIVDTLDYDLIADAIPTPIAI